ncbi:MAG: ATP-binding cassette domain-containing protein, partial [Chloroflexota bacterium]|nr:ATP-binding cassette domain-containing protein [Chloroflexota bacterium]
MAKALDGVSLTVGRGEIVGILGPNGSGKSTLVRVISTLILPDAGTIEVFGLDALKH